jgi:HK97 gp10 family phage protein
MPFEISAKVRNKDRLFQKLKALAPDVAEEVEAANLKLAQDMVTNAKSFVPVDRGDLRDSIVATPGGQSTPGYSQPGGSLVVPEGSVAVTAGNSKVRYPHLVEYGTRAHIAGGFAAGATIPAIPARPYFWPAFRLIRSKMKRQVSAAVRRALKRATAG